MAGSVNKVMIVGRLGADPEQRRTQSGVLVVNCSIATDESWMDQDSNERKERTEWHRVVFFGRLAEIAGQYLRKGKLVYVEGRLQTRKWQDSRTGQDRYSTEIIARDMTMLGARGEGEGDGFSGSRTSGYNQASEIDSGSSASQPVSSDSSSDFPEDPAEDIPW